MPYPGRNNIYNAVIRRRVRAALNEQERIFTEEHRDDSDEMLLQYLRDWAEQLRHTPWPGEITGTNLILKRFGTWEHARKKAGLPEPDTPNRQSGFARYAEEMKRQKKVCREKRQKEKNGLLTQCDQMEEPTDPQHDFMRGI